jgi:hypothetical protein
VYLQKNGLKQYKYVYLSVIYNTSNESASFGLDKQVNVSKSV